jgi:uncharacterized protein
MRFLLSLVGIVSLLGSAQAEFLYVTSNDVYQQDFDSLQNSGSGLTWTNNSTLPGWYSNHSSYNASSGASGSRRLYSFGSDGSLERGLGIVALGSSSDPRFGIAIRNTTGVTLNSVNVSFDGEQWRHSSTPTAAPQTLQFGYRTSSSLGTIDGGVYTNAVSLGFTSPGFSVPGGEVNGNAPENRTANISSSLSDLNWLDGEYLWLRWQAGSNGFGSQHGLGIDNFSFSASGVTAVPEPSSLALVAISSLIALRRRRRSSVSVPRRSAS